MAFTDSKLFRLIWVLLFALSTFVLGYTLHPRPSRRTMLQGFRPSTGARRLPPPLPGRFPVRR